MNRATFRRRRMPGGGWAVTSTLVAVLLVSVSAPALAQTPGDKYDRMRDRQTRESLFSLFAEPTMVLDVNQYQCGLRNQGDTCSDVFNSPTGGGGFWPTASPNQYMFNSGINLAGIIPADAGFAWAGDTTGAYFFDASGDQQVGEGLTNIYNSLNTEDLANWPCATEGDAVLPDAVTGPCTSIPNFETATAFVTDTALFESVLIGRKAASQQDSWLLYWEGNPALGGGVRDHPMGITVEQRTMAWNFPEGNEATIYIIYKFTNVTDNPYFQRLNEAQYFGGENGLPDEGWQIDSIYVSFDVDPDVTNDYDKNYSTAILPFNMGVAYEGEFQAEEFTYFPDLFRPPFFTNAPGLVGVKYLQSPVDAVTGEQVGLTLFTVHENPSSPGVQFRDPAGVKQLWRYLSGNIRPSLGDPPCTFSNPKERRLCFLAQTPKDTRFLQASGPFSLAPGESQTVVVAQFAAATVATDLIELGNTNANAPGVPSLRPGCGVDEVRPIEVGAGWISTPSEACLGGTGVLDEFQIPVVPGSLLSKGLTAQTIFNGKFVLPGAPEPPPFYLVEGNNQISIVWERSATDTVGDPFYEAASDAESELYNPNYRQYDVEGYRLYRGSSPDQMQLIAQFDYTNRPFEDVNCETDPTFLPGEDCPGWGPDGIPGTEDDEPESVDIVDPFIQYPGGGIVELADGSPFVIAADTALSGRVTAGTSRPLTNTGIPFAYIDQGVKNGFQYFYQVKAFDVNSLKSGPTSLESSSEIKSAFPQAPASDLTSADFSVGLIDRDGNVLEGQTPDIDAETGTFSGPAAPTNNLFGNFLAFAPQLLSTGTFEVRIDSIIPLYYGGEAYFTLSGPGIVTQRVHFETEDLPCDAGACVYEVLPINVPSDSVSREDLIDAGIEAPPSSGQLTSTFQFDHTQWHSGDSDWAYQVPGFWSDVPPERALDGGSRWFSGENETMADPTLGLAHGELDGVDVIFQPVPYQEILADPEPECGSAGPDHMRRFYQTTWAAHRAADIKVYWGSAGVDSVIDVTHNLEVPYSPAVRASYGFVNTDANQDGMIDYVDFWYLDGLQETSTIGCLSDENPQTAATQPVLQQVDADGDRVADGQGFAMYIAGEPYIFQTSSLPSGTVWTLRAYNGIAARENGVYTFQETARTAGVPGLRFALTVTAPAAIDETTADLAKVHTVPDPYYAVSQFDLGPATKNLRFVNLPARATIRIYSLSGVLVNVINHDDASGGGQATWDVRNRSNQFVASGVYFYIVTSPTGDKHVGKFTIVNFAN